MKAFLLVVAIFLFAHHTATAQSDPANVACYQSGGSCRAACPFPAVASGDCAGDQVCCQWPSRSRPA